MNVYLTGHQSPRVKIDLQTGSNWIPVDCLIDTGFSSGLALKQSILSQIKGKPVAQQEFELADGSIVNLDVYLTRIKFKNRSQRLPTVFTESNDNLVGMDFLRKRQLKIDLKSNPGKISLK